MKYIILTLTFLIFNIIVSGCSDIKASNIDPEEFEKLKSSGHVVIDVRTPAEFSKGHIEGAILIDYNSPDYKERIKNLDKNNKYIVYCRSGNRSGKGLSVFTDAGLEAKHLEGGIVSWEKAGKSVVKP